LQLPQIFAKRCVGGEQRLTTVQKSTDVVSGIPTGVVKGIPIDYHKATRQMNVVCRKDTWDHRETGFIQQEDSTVDGPCLEVTYLVVAVPYTCPKHVVEPNHLSDILVNIEMKLCVSGQ
jgi:hypothetical protein